MSTQTLIQPKLRGNKITIEIPKTILEGLLGYKEKEIHIMPKKTNWSEVKKLKGIWKKKKIDPLKYERQIRAEWS